MTDEIKSISVKRIVIVSEDVCPYTERIYCPEKVYECCNDILKIRTYSVETFLVFSVDTKKRITGISTITQGTLNASLVHPREVFQAALLHNAASIILVHNHPSGDPAPSPEDIAVTRKLIEAGRIMGIPVSDHIIIGDDRLFPPGFHSIRRSGCVEFE